MPFYTPSNEPKSNIDYSHCRPAQVIFHTSMDGTIRPIKFNYANDDESVVRMNVDSVKYAKD